MTIIYHDRFLEHRQRHDTHPESPARLIAIRDRLEREGLWENVVAPSAATASHLERVHDRLYLDRLREHGEGPWDPDTYMRHGTLELAMLAAGGALLAGNLAFVERKPKLALLRPPGHHATRKTAMGFCYLNNVAVVVADIVRRHGVRVAIVDIDVHHGNGTEDIFYESSQVLAMSLHQYPFYPGTGGIYDVGKGSGCGFNVNLPLPAGCGNATYRMALDEVVAPILRGFEPHMLFVSLGADAHYLDPLALMQLDSRGYLDCMRRLYDLAGELCAGRFAVILEGGYQVDALAEVVALTAALFEGREIELRHCDGQDGDAQNPLGADAVSRIQGVLEQYWKL